MENLTVGNHVSLFYSENTPYQSWRPLGKVMGFGTSNGQPIVIVQLDAPEWTESKTHFISVIVVHASCVRPTSKVYN